MGCEIWDVGLLKLMENTWKQAPGTEYQIQIKSPESLIRGFLFVRKADTKRQTDASPSYAKEMVSLPAY
jgi:hypothetical protein